MRRGLPVGNQIEWRIKDLEMDESVKQTRLEIYLDRAASQWSDHTAVVDSTGQALTYSQLHNLADKVGAFLTTRGFGPGDLIAFMMAKRCEAIGLMFGTMKVGAGYVPLDRNAGPGRIRQILGDCGVRVLFADEEALAQLQARGLPGHGITTVVLPTASPGSATRWADALPTADSTNLTGPAPIGDDLAYLLYTSGSTGMPKGVKSVTAMPSALWNGHRSSSTSQRRTVSPGMPRCISIYQCSMSSPRCAVVRHYTYWRRTWQR